MSIKDVSPSFGVASVPTSTIPRAHIVVAIVIEWRGRIAMFKRSQLLGHDRGLWHCITGYLEPGASPREQALEELFEETGLLATNLLDFRPGPALVVNDNDGEPWLVHTFTAISSRRRLEIDWEHDEYHWTAPGKVMRFANRVPWLDSVLHATGFLTH